ncbi:hypothetical protein [Flexibacterium corallicola]|uniref:hypothetical protein n=1 Tax=Flexibacterium corallicola TaxID=3037259 RepID=UPI00286F67E6|nr:hypothetical protein [Pseudovibrio sp. M1P-2-3]
MTIRKASTLRPPAIKKAAAKTKGEAVHLRQPKVKTPEAVTAGTPTPAPPPVVKEPANQQPSGADAEQLASAALERAVIELGLDNILEAARLIKQQAATGTSLSPPSPGGIETEADKVKRYGLCPTAYGVENE